MDLTKLQNDILNAAIVIIANYGLAHLSIRHIARDVGIHESTIYSHFKSKDEILECILDNYMDNAVSKCAEFELNGKSCLNKIELHFKNNAMEFITAPEKTKVYWLSLMSCEGAAFEKVKAISNYIKNWLCKTIEEGQKNSEITSDYSAKNLSSIVTGNIYLYCRRQAFNNDYDIKDNIQDTWKMIEKMLSDK